jgi:hypothetical protein
MLPNEDCSVEPILHNTFDMSMVPVGGEKVEINDQSRYLTNRFHDWLQSKNTQKLFQV